jgi:gliding motility-associated-like protein
MHKQKNYLTVFMLYTCISLKMYGGNPQVTETNTNVYFIENKKQWEENIIYRAELDGGVMFLEKNCFTYNFYDKEMLRSQHANNKYRYTEEKKTSSYAFRAAFVNALPTVKFVSNKPTSDYCNYFIGKDKNKWVGDVKKYQEVLYKNLYGNIDLQLQGLQNSVKYNFIVAPLGNTNDIVISYTGLKDMFLDKGALHLKTNLNEIIEQSPYAYQWIGSKKIEVHCEFVLENKIIHFNFPQGYNRNYELIIDPVLVFACSSGSLSDNFGMTATYDSEGNLYSGGTCFDMGYPTTIGAYDSTYNGVVQEGRTDVVITKYDASGKFLKYSTYLGGASGTEIVSSLIVNSQNELLLYGATGSSDFPVTSAAYDKSFNGGTLLHFITNGSYFDKGTDIYISKFNVTGTALLASTYLGGTLNDGVNINNDSIRIPFSNPPEYDYPADSLQYNYGDQYRGEINLDKYGDVYLVSSTRSGDFPIVNGFDKNMGGKQDAIVCKLNGDLSKLIWSTYLGGSDNDAGNALALDDSANVYVTGGTRSNNFPTTAGVLQTVYSSGKADGYITKIKKDGTSILSSTYWGTPAYDQCYFIQLDKDNDVYIVGQTTGKMPVTAGVYNNPNSGQFISKIDQLLTNLIFSTVFGNGSGAPNISPSAFLVDYCENIYVSGWGGDIIKGIKTTGMPVTPNAIQPTTDGFNFYLFVLSTNATSLFYATYFGGQFSEEHVDGGTSRFDKRGIVYQSVCAGCGGNDDFPVTPGSWPNDPGNVNHSFNCNNGTFKLDFQIPIAQANFTVDFFKGCAPLTVKFKNQSKVSKFFWDLGNNDTTSVDPNPIRTYTIPGIYKIKLIVNDPASCNIWDTAFQYITVFPPIKADFDFISPPCSKQANFIDSSAVSPTSWLWYFDDGDSSKVQNPTHVYTQPGTYDVTLIVTDINGCKDTAVTQVNLAEANVSVNKNKRICKEQSVQLLASGGIAYSWAPTTGLNNSSIPNPVASPMVTTTYTVSITTINALGDTCKVSLPTTVTVIDLATINLSANADKDTLSPGGSTIIHAVTDTTLSIKWNPTTGVSDSTSFNPTVHPTVTTTYTVTIVDSSGCIKTATVTVYILSKECTGDNVFIPNTFTPNGDGENDVLYVRSNSITQMYFAIYDRWGELMFETTDLHKGWDGLYKGMKVNPDVFAWYVKATCRNGENFFKKGNVTLIR